MTDIRQHLPGILSSLRQHLSSEDITTPEMFRGSLRALLPSSYGVVAGCLVNAEGQQSLPLDMIISDMTIAATLPSSPETSCHELRQALAIILIAEEITTRELQDLLRTIAGVKILRSDGEKTFRQSSRSGHSRTTLKSNVSLRNVLPLAILACQNIADLPQDDPEALSLALDALLKAHPEYLRPDYLLLPGQQLFYRNPQLSGDPFVPSTINIAREPALKKPHPCYVCKQPFTCPHFFYRYLCLACGDLNYRKRAISVDLTGRIALVTGARVKIGYATALRLLRAGARVIVTTRFPHDAARRYCGEPDFADWQDRLEIYGLDFRYLPILERFVAHLSVHYPALDILINNAAQTVRRPLDYYAHLLPAELVPLADLPPAEQVLVHQSHAVLPPTPFIATGELTTFVPMHLSNRPSATLLHDYGSAAISPHAATFPVGQYDEHQQQLDLRPRNSWTLPFNEIDLTEFLEVQVINVTAPFLLVSHLHPLLLRSTFASRFVINVSAIEGQFANAKAGKHVHTNMAKASLNMLTHTAAAELVRDQILMNSVDPGWISQQAPLTDTERWEKIQQRLPLDLVDAAARICEPIFRAVATGEAVYGQFFKDYQPTSW
jgi:NAD(P)-dependent dehydrogenase (short-subunit alcohol dehydrogenase family)